METETENGNGSGIGKWSSQQYVHSTSYQCQGAASLEVHHWVGVKPGLWTGLMN